MWNQKVEWEHLVTQHKQFLRLHLDSGAILIHSNRTNSCSLDETIKSFVVYEASLKQVCAKIKLHCNNKYEEEATLNQIVKVPIPQR